MSRTGILNGLPALLSAAWRDIALLSWPVADRILEPFLPSGLEPDHWQGRAYISLVGLRLDNVRVLGLPGIFRSYPEVNLRFYVRRGGDAGQDRGVVFIRQTVPHRLISLAARRVFHEPFTAAPMWQEPEHCGDGGEGVSRVAYGWRQAGRDEVLRVEAQGEPRMPARGSLEEFLTARFRGYRGKPGGGLLAYQVKRPPWAARKARCLEVDCDYGASIGITLNAEGMTWPAQAATVQDLATTSDINMIYNFPSFPDAHAILNTSFNGALTGYNGGYNWAQYSNPEVDALLNAAATHSDQEERARLYQEAQRLIGADHVVITVSNPGFVLAMSDRVEGYVYNVAHHQTFNIMDMGLRE